MNLAELRAAIEAARVFETQVRGVTFKLKLPEEYAWRVAYEEARDAGGRVIAAKLLRRVASEAIVGWSGLTVAMLLGNESEEPIAFSDEAKGLLLNQRTSYADELYEVIAAKMLERSEKLGASAKNSGRASTTS